MTLGALEPKFLRQFCDSNGLPCDLMLLVPGEHQVKLKEAFAAVIASRTRAEWEAWNGAQDACIEPVLAPEELRTDAQIRARGIFVDVPAGTETVSQFRTPVTPRDLPIRPAPAAGEHTSEILRAAGFTDGEIESLKSARAVV
jgi:alpha-methylacyl-CoA racemase